jgi:hypothetical protein
VQSHIILLQVTLLLRLCPAAVCCMLLLLLVRLLLSRLLPAHRTKSLNPSTAASHSAAS